MSVIRKAVFPVAGLGTRFLPATKASPKEMLPIVDKPLIQYAVEEAVAASGRSKIISTRRPNLRRNWNARAAGICCTWCETSCPRPLAVST